jgi:hypothetical protein
MLSKMGDLADFLMLLHTSTDEKGCEGGKASPLSHSFLVCIWLVSATLTLSRLDDVKPVWKATHVMSKRL